MSERIVSDYFGAAALALAGFALAAGSGSGRWLWAAIAALGLIAGSAGARARVFGADWDGEPLLAALRVALPGFDRFRSPAVAMGWTTLAGVMLAAIGLDRLLRPPAERRGKYAAALFALVAAALALVSIVCRYRAASLARTVEAMGGGEELWAALLPRKAAGYSAAILALAAALAALGQRAGPANARLRQALCAGWIALLAGDAFVKSRAYTAPPLDHADFLRYHEQSVPAALRADPRRPVRVLQKGQELTNAFMLGGVGSIHGYHPIVYRRYERLVRRYWLVGPEISALLHQNWLLWPPDETPPTGWRAAEATARGLLLQRDPPAPYAFFPERIETVSGESDAFRALEGEGFDPRRTTYAEAPTPLPARSAAPEPPVRLVQYEAGEVVFETALERPMTAVFADLMAPGWTLRRWDARGQGEEIPALVANGAIRGAVLPAGAARYEWRYEPFSFRLGLFLSLAAWSALLAFAISKAKRKPGAGDAGLETRSSK